MPFENRPIAPSVGDIWDQFEAKKKKLRAEADHSKAPLQTQIDAAEKTKTEKDEELVKAIQAPNVPPEQIIALVTEHNAYVKKHLRTVTGLKAQMDELDGEIAEFEKQLESLPPDDDE